MDSDFKPFKQTGKSNKAKKTSVDSSVAAVESFKTPDEVAAADTLEPPQKEAKTASAGLASQNDGRLKRLIRKLNLKWPPGNKEYALIGASVVVLALVGFLLFGRGSKANSFHQGPKKPAKPVQTAITSNLTGLPVSPDVLKRPVIGVMIENSPDARPQSGLSDAGVVFEAIAEGGITRFLALYQDNIPNNIGPIRSARPYFVQWNMGFDAGYAHVGGSPDALNLIRSDGTRDDDQFANSGSYHRISSRAAPHNVYTGVQNLMDLEISKGRPTSTFTGFTRKQVVAQSKPTVKQASPNKQSVVKPAPPAKTIDLDISGPLYNVHYDYQEGSKTYNRSEGGSGHPDANTGNAISPRVVVAMVIPYSLADDGYHSNYAVVGNGEVYVFQDGTVTHGTWGKTSEKAQIQFFDDNKQPLLLEPGQTWLTAVTGREKVHFNP